jgi:hypothetical protein
MESNTSVIDLSLWDMMTVVTGMQIVLIGLVVMIGIIIVIIVVIVVVLLHDAMACGNHTC